MAETLKWLYDLVFTFLEWSNKVFAALQSTFSELIDQIPTNNVVTSLISSALTFITDGLGIGNLTIIGFLYGSGFVVFIALMLIRWIRGLM